MHLATITRDANGTPTGASFAGSTMLAGMMHTITGALTPDVVVVPNGMLESFALAATPFFLGAEAQLYRDTGKLGIPLFKKGDLASFGQ